MTAMSAFLCLGVGLLAGAEAPKAGGDQAARDDGWVIVRKPRSELLSVSRVVFSETMPRQGYIKRSVGLSGQTLPTQVGAVAGTPGITVERITLDGGKVEITAGSIVIEGGRAEIIRRPGQ
jgi:hypothetical protein